MQNDNMRMLIYHTEFRMLEMAGGAYDSLTQFRDV